MTTRIELSPARPESRRRALMRALCSTWVFASGHGLVRAHHAMLDEESGRRFYEAAAAMKRLAESWGDQPYGAVLVARGEIIGEGPSRVVKNADPTAHAEREAIRDAQRRLGRKNLAGTILYSTSRPCPMCERAAAEAGVARMIHGETLTDAGVPSG